MRWESDSFRMITDAIEANRHRMISEQAKDAAPLWEITDLIGYAGADSDVNEISEISVSIENTEGPELGINKIRCSLDDTTQGSRQFQTSRDRDNRGEQPPVNVLAHSPIMPASSRDGHTRGQLGYHSARLPAFLPIFDLRGQRSGFTWTPARTSYA